MGAKRLVNVGDTFGRLTILKEDEPLIYLKKNGKPYSKRVFTVICSCGNSEPFNTQLNHLVTGKSSSCGCLHLEHIDKSGLELRKTHGMTGSPTYVTWQMMKRRCYDKTHKEWPRYGGNGVTVCKDWLESFENFYKDMGERPVGCTLNRVKGSKIYSKDSCEWATMSIQSYDQGMKKTNKSGKTGVCLVKDKWVAQIGRLNQRIRLGSFDSFEDALKVRELAEMELYGFTKK